MLGCLAPKRAEINATLWLNNSPLPIELCAQHQELNNYGFYRRITDDNFEFISFCDQSASKWIAIHESDLEKLLDKYVPESKGNVPGAKPK